MEEEIPPLFYSHQPRPRANTYFDRMGGIHSNVGKLAGHVSGQ